MPISALPTPPSRSDSPQDFSDRADALLGALPGFVTEANALQSDVNAKEASASSHATIATNKAAEAQGHATTASTKASEAAAAAVAAAAAASNAEIAFDSFDDKYLGSKASDPATDNDGNPILTGALYWNTSVGAVRVWNGSSWLSMAADASIVDFQQAGAGAVVRTAQDKMREFVSVSDYSSAAAAVDNITTSGLLHVPNGGTTAPISAAGKNILWEYDQGGDSDNVLDLNGTRGGFFADYDCKAGKVLVYQVRENQSAIAGGGFRDLLFLNTVDNDTTNYTAVGQKCTYGVRSYVQGAYVSGNYQPQYKDLVGGEFYAIGNIQWDDRGCSGITAAAVQYGSGIASNEFSVQNPASGAAGGVEQSLSMAAIQPIIRAQFADEDATHKVRGVFVSNVGRRATAGVELLSSTAEGYSGHYKRAIEMGGAVVTDAAISMPQSASGNVGTIIVYDPNDYSVFDRENNRFGWVVGGVQNLTVNEKGVGVGLAIAPTAQTRLQINSSTSALSHLQLVAGSTPSAPNNGEIWFDGFALKIVIGGVVRTVTIT